MVVEVCKKGGDSIPVVGQKLYLEKGFNMISSLILSSILEEWAPVAWRPVPRYFCFCGGWCLHPWPWDLRILTLVQTEMKRLLGRHLTYQPQRHQNPNVTTLWSRPAGRPYLGTYLGRQGMRLSSKNNPDYLDYAQGNAI